MPPLGVNGSVSTSMLVHSFIDWWTCGRDVQDQMYWTKLQPGLCWSSVGDTESPSLQNVCCSLAVCVCVCLINTAALTSEQVSYFPPPQDIKLQQWCWPHLLLRPTHPRVLRWLGAVYLLFKQQWVLAVGKCRLCWSETRKVSVAHFKCCCSYEVVMWCCGFLVSLWK